MNQHVSPSSATKSDPGSALTIVDCDFHPFVPLEEVFARMSKGARSDVEVTDFQAVLGREYNRFLHPTGNPLRLDAIPPQGGLAASDPKFAQGHYLDAWGISAAIIMPTQSQALVAWASPRAVDDFCRGLNDLFIELWHQFDQRYKLLITVSPHDPDAAVKEIERMAAVPGVVGVQVPLAEISVGSSIMHKLYDAAAQNDLPVIFHPNGADNSLMNSPTSAGQLTRSYAERHALLGQVGQGVAASVVLGGVLAKFPRLKVVLTEFGFSWVAPVMWRMDQFWRESGGPDGVLNRPPSEYMIEQMRFSTQPFDEPEDPRRVWPLLDAMHAERTMLFSSDYPHWDTDHPQVILSNRLPPKLRDRVSHLTAMETFGARLGL